MSEPPADGEIETAKVELQQLLRSRYVVEKSRGQGGAGIVFEITDTSSGIKRVAKILRPSARLLDDLKEEFKGEAQKLAHLRHQNLVTVFEQSQPDDVPYFVMEFITGPELDKAAGEIAKLNPRGKWVSEIRKIALQLADVLAYLHSQRPKPLLHLDLKPENIILSRDYRDKPLPILLDFGISRSAESKEAEVRETPVRGTFPMWPKSYMGALKRMTNLGRTLFLIDRARINTDLDLHLLGRTLHLTLAAGLTADSEISEWDPIAKSEYQFLTEIVERLDIDQPTSPAFESAAELRTALRRLELRASRTRSYLDDGSVKIPGRSIRSYGVQARALTDWPKFQRLRVIRQLGLTYLVYPGATHTRFEHALGVFENAVEVLDHISGPSGDYRFRAVVSDEELAGTALVALLHDIGHYPFAHQFRIGGEFPRHELRTLQLIQSRELKKLITDNFNADVYKATLAIMQCVDAYENPRRRGRKEPQYPTHYRVLRAVVSSSIDVDKLDYVGRDSLHCGVPYGQIVDRERFLSSLRIWWDQNGSPQLLLSDKGRVCAEALVFARYQMTSEVYWNHAVRSYAATLSSAIDQFETDEVRGRLWDDDLRFMNWLGTDKRSKWFVALVTRRKPYRRAFVHQRLGGGDTAVDGKLFELLEEAAQGDKEKLDGIRDVVADVLHIKQPKHHEVVLDVPGGMPRVQGVQVLPEGHEEPGSVGPIFDAIGENFDGFARKARIFVHPDIMKKRSVAESTAAVRKALIEGFQLER